MVNLILQEKLNESSGIFTSNGDIYLITKEQSSLQYSIKTKYLEMKGKVHVNSVKNDQSFISGLYTVLIFKVNDDIKKKEIFIDLCRSYSIQKKMTIDEFFSNLKDIFSADKNIPDNVYLGLLGELIFIRKCLVEYNFNPIKMWNHSSMKSRIDFTFEETSFEVKTTLRQELQFKIKESQIRNSKNLYLYLLNLEEVNTGLSLSNVYDEIKSVVNSENKFLLEMKINKIVDITDYRFQSKEYKIHNELIVDAKDIKKILNIPEEITSISYLYNFRNTPKVKLDDVLTKLVV